MKKFTLILATVALLAAGCSKTEVVGPQNRKGINFAAYTAKTTKAAQEDVTTDNLSSFKVTAIGNGAIYFDDISFAKNASSIWVSNPEYFWPAFPLTFCAYNTPSGYATQVQPTGFGKTINTTTQTLEVTPAPQLADQEDLVAAYAAGMTEINARNAGNTALPLTFNHYLTQVIVKARNASSTYQVVVDGVKIANMAGHGTYTFKTNEMLAPEEAVNSEYSINYTATFTRAKTLGSDAQEVMTDAGTGKWYLIPQTVTAWDRGDGLDENKMKNSSHGTYLALKVIIKTKDGAQIYPKTGVQTAWMAVPIPTSWASTDADAPTSIFKQGKKYTIILDFFGNGGAGYVDPQDPGELDGDTDTKDNGKAIVGGPIRFDASVSGWTDVTITISL